MDTGKTAVTFNDSSRKGEQRNGAVAGGRSEGKRSFFITRAVGACACADGSGFSVSSFFPALAHSVPSSLKSFRAELRCPFFSEASSASLSHTPKGLSFLLPTPHSHSISSRALQSASCDYPSTSSLRTSRYRANLCIHTFPTAPLPLRNIPGAAW